MAIRSPLKLHATTIIWGEDGILIRGSSGSGKTTLACAFVAEGSRLNIFSRFVADDVTLVSASSGRLVARPHPAIRGRIERRGIGLLDVEHEPACVVRLVLDLELGDRAVPERLPGPESTTTTILGVALPCLALPRGAPASDNVYRALDFTAAFRARS